MAAERGCEVRLITSPNAVDFRNVTELRGTLADGRTVSVAGTLTGPRMVPKVIGINGFDLEIPLSSHMAFFTYEDRPGVIGQIGGLLGDANVNIASMQVARNDDATEALVALTLDSTIPDDVLSAIAETVRTEAIQVANLE
jgi:D-3-phosphoglycerate dehydrogenase